MASTGRQVVSQDGNKVTFREEFDDGTPARTWVEDYDKEPAPTITPGNNPLDLNPNNVYPGGKFWVNGRFVDANGEPIKKDKRPAEDPNDVQAFLKRQDEESERRVKEQEARGPSAESEANKQKQSDGARAEGPHNEGTGGVVEEREPPKADSRTQEQKDAGAKQPAPPAPPK